MSASELPEGPRTRRRVRGGAGVAWALVAVLVLVAALAWLRFEQRQTMVDAATDAEAAARAAVTDMLTYDHRSLDEDFAWVEDNGTDRFVQAFEGSAQSVREIALATRAVSVGSIVRSAAHVEDNDDVSVLVVADSEITKASGLPIEERWFVALSMVREDGRWLVDELELL